MMKPMHWKGNQVCFSANHLYHSLVVVIILNMIITPHMYALYACVLVYCVLATSSTPRPCIHIQHMSYASYLLFLTCNLLKRFTLFISGTYDPLWGNMLPRSSPRVCCVCMSSFLWLMSRLGLLIEPKNVCLSNNCIIMSLSDKGRCSRSMREQNTIQMIIVIIMMMIMVSQLLGRSLEKVLLQLEFREREKSE